MPRGRLDRALVVSNAAGSQVITWYQVQSSRTRRSAPTRGFECRARRGFKCRQGTWDRVQPHTWHRVQPTSWDQVHRSGRLGAVVTDAKSRVVSNASTSCVQVQTHVFSEAPTPDNPLKYGWISTRFARLTF
jgi:hypothetical protein